LSAVQWTAYTGRSGHLRCRYGRGLTLPGLRTSRGGNAAWDAAGLPPERAQSNGVRAPDCRRVGAGSH